MYLINEIQTEQGMSISHFVGISFSAKEFFTEEYLLDYFLKESPHDCNNFQVVELA